MRGGVVEGLSNQVHVEPSGGRDDRDDVPTPCVDDDRLEDDVRLDAERAGLGERRLRRIVVDHLVGHATRIEIVGDDGHVAPPRSARRLGGPSSGAKGRTSFPSWAPRHLVSRGPDPGTMSPQTRDEL
jgi:hypothetical protein